MLNIEGNKYYYYYYYYYIFTKYKNKVVAELCQAQAMNK